LWEEKRTEVIEAGDEGGDDSLPTLVQCGPLIRTDRSIEEGAKMRGGVEGEVEASEWKGSATDQSRTRLHC
jgi:hypothetical protein